jgi:hypothetical protein
LFVIVNLLLPCTGFAWGDEVSEVTSAIQVMNEIMSIPEGGIPDSLL